MGITGSIIVYVCIWWVVFFAMLPIGVKSNPPQIDKKLEGFDSGAPKNPEIGKKFLFTTLITSIIFMGIYYMVSNNYLNLREILQ
tara:strand:- start:293 stop:547 length:255 start_codon:yes stop_codon:yes gene_type:complete